MTHNDFNHIVESLNALSPDQLQRLRDQLDSKLTEARQPIASAGSEPTPAHSGKPIWERILERSAAIPDEEWDKLPVDGAEQHDHYIYGTPKRPSTR
jgi:hypothetical protein